MHAPGEHHASVVGCGASRGPSGHLRANRLRDLVRAPRRVDRIHRCVHRAGLLAPAQQPVPSRGRSPVLAARNARCYPVRRRRYFDYDVGFTAGKSSGRAQDCAGTGPRVHRAAPQPGHSQGRERGSHRPTLQSPFFRVPMLAAWLRTPAVLHRLGGAYQPLDMRSAGHLKFLRQQLRRPRVAGRPNLESVRRGAGRIEAAAPPGSIDFVAREQPVPCSPSRTSSACDVSFKPSAGDRVVVRLGNKSKTGKWKARQGRAGLRPVK